MTSAFAWLDHDDTHRRRMLAAVELFNEAGSIDEIGVGAVRDTISGVLFPGASVLHTRARYLLFVPWTAQAAAAQGLPEVAAARELRRLEISLIDALKAGGERTGVIGSRAGERTKRLPSDAYWPVLRRWRIRTTDRSVRAWLRDASVAGRLAAGRPRADTGDDPVVPLGSGFDPGLPPPPADLVTRTGFDLSRAEAVYLAERLRIAAPASLLPWLLDHGVAGDEVWDHPDVADMPAHLGDLVDRGRRFSSLTLGAALLYNLMLAEKRGTSDRIDDYAARLADWALEVRENGAASAWDRHTFWMRIRQENPAVKRATETFVETWIERVNSGADLRVDPYARTLIRDRETALKAGRARLVNAAALDRWNGESGLTPLDYNWRVAQRIVGDVVAGLG